ncbi:hypothetical protein RKE25_23295 (plasmid) [Dyella sp. BiH032]|uniref:hypothetical protein n=1 Tax=Dyella sp. BiH032 TaxID=3075430 RepID=UPI002892FA18|nr:hypothetical protein [Dyella sp. BiH032]WNL48542.1 hypothetical protein RKE25_23295 [Dyella sp. BiH032]
MSNATTTPKAFGSIETIRALNGNGAGDWDQLRAELNALEDKLIQAGQCISRLRDLSGWNPTDPAQGFVGAVNAALFISYTIHELHKLLGWYENKPIQMRMIHDLIVDAQLKCGAALGWVQDTKLISAIPDWSAR